MQLKRFLTYLLIACILISLVGFLMVIFEMDFGLYLVFGSLAVGTFPAFCFASPVAFKRGETGKSDDANKKSDRDEE
jgi:hypothetical protein